MNKRPIESDYTSHVAYTRSLEEYCDWLTQPADVVERIEAFAELMREEAIAEANARANASWTLMCEKMVAIEREACAMVCEPQEEQDDPLTAWKIAAAIRARSNT